MNGTCRQSQSGCAGERITAMSKGPKRMRPSSTRASLSWSPSSGSLRKIIELSKPRRLANSFRYTEMITKIWIEQLCHPDGRARYTSRGQLYRTRLGRPDGEVLCQETISPVCPSCRALLARGITGSFETWRESVPYACMRGDI